MSDSTTTPAPLTADERAAIARRVEALPAGPWSHGWEGQQFYVRDADDEEIVEFTFAIPTWGERYEQAKATCDLAVPEFIAHAREDIPRLLATVEAAERRGGVMLTFDELRAANVARCESAFHLIDEWTPTDWMTAVAGEVGEAANLVKKRRRGEDIPTQAIARELADAVIYLDLLAARLGIDLGDAVREKFNVVSERVGSEVRP